MQPIPERRRTAFANTFDEFHGLIERRPGDPTSCFMGVANKSNDYLRDMELQRDRLFFGVPFVGNLQDRAMTERMCNDAGEPIYDRTQENLGSSDLMVSMVRKRLLDALRQHAADRSVPANVDDPDLDRVRCATLVLPAGADWQTASEEARIARPGVPATYEVPLIID